MNKRQREREGERVNGFLKAWVFAVEQERPEATFPLPRLKSIRAGMGSVLFPAVLPDT